MIIIYAFIFNILSQTSGDSIHHFVLSVQDIAMRHLSPKDVLVVSHSSGSQQISTGSIKLVGSDSSELGSVDIGLDILLEKLAEALNEVQEWPLLNFALYDVSGEIGISKSKLGTYIILSAQQTHAEAVSDVISQIEKLRNNWEWNPRAKFVIIILKINDIDMKEVAADIFIKLWKFNAIDVIIVMSSTNNSQLAKYMSVIDIYTWFPYNRLGRCADVKEAVLLDSWVLDNRG
ncbi:hypothetical protein ANN_02437 [Periplaneta americana]|uniref:Uncharacterized protein n=1 Tax=Periplaneta americana TaxID=6978 RepID=A0ABQ8TW91_PERAM|nr:hypothetical protein ANN_02437 [Periplaneta americana]